MRQDDKIKQATLQAVLAQIARGEVDPKCRKSLVTALRKAKEAVSHSKTGTF